MFLLLIVSLGIAIAMHVISSRKNIQVYRETNGCRLWKLENTLASALSLNREKGFPSMRYEL